MVFRIKFPLLLDEQTGPPTWNGQRSQRLGASPKISVAQYMIEP